MSLRWIGKKSINQSIEIERGCYFTYFSGELATIILFGHVQTMLFYI